MNVKHSLMAKPSNSIISRLQVDFESKGLFKPSVMGQPSDIM